MIQTLIYIPLYNILIFFFVYVKDMGVSVILLTILIRILLLKPSIKAEKSRLELQKLQPEIKKIQEKYKDNKEKQTKGMLELYQKKGINPFSSCLPILLQFPLLIGLFRVFSIGLKNGYPLYGPIKSLASNIAINATAFGFLNLTLPPNKGLLLILPILATALQYYQSRLMMSQSSPSEASAATNSLMLLMPGLTFIFTLTLPAALSLYWIATTLFAIGQQYAIDYEIKKHSKEGKN